eukprot:1156950-Pelagomonas_calceolata.AAC.2
MGSQGMTRKACSLVSWLIGHTAFTQVHHHGILHAFVVQSWGMCTLQSPCSKAINQSNPGCEYPVKGSALACSV